MQNSRNCKITSTSKRTVISVLLVLLLCSVIAPNAIAESTDIGSRVIVISPPGEFEGCPLKATCRTEDGTCWFVGGNTFQGNWMLQTDAEGNVLHERIITDAPGELPLLRCLSQVEGKLILCFIDGDTMHGTLGLMDDPAGKIEYRDMGKLKIFAMQAVADGILVSGIMYDDEANTYQLQFKCIGPEGEICFQYNGKPHSLIFRIGAVTASLCVASGDGYYVQEYWNETQDFFNRRSLAYVDNEGHEVWRILLQDRMFPDGMAATDDGVYLVGDTYDLNDEGTAENKRAFVQYYTKEGELQWTQTFEKERKFSRVAANENACIVWTRNGAVWYFHVINPDGTLRNILEVNSERNVSAALRIYLLENGNILALGDSYYDLLLVEIPRGSYE
jgi:hypothetical protein